MHEVAPPVENVFAAHGWHTPEDKYLPATQDVNAGATHADEDVEPVTPLVV